MIILLLIAIAFVVAYSLAHHLMPALMQSFLTPILVAAILYILGFAAATLLHPFGSTLKLAAICSSLCDPLW